jgi:ribosome-associated translation inhibitor RaiA
MPTLAFMPMKLTVEHHHLPSTHELDSLIEERIIALQPRLQIDEAKVRLEHRRECSPAFRVHVHLVTPGPDVLAEGLDHTIRAAMEKVMTALEARVGERVEKRRRSVRSRPQERKRVGGGRSGG